MKLEWLPQAILDFNEIIDYIAEDNPVAAIGQGDEIERQVAGLAANHLMGRPGRPVRRPGKCRLCGVPIQARGPANVR